MFRSMAQNQNRLFTHLQTTFFADKAVALIFAAVLLVLPPAAQAFGSYPGNWSSLYPDSSSDNAGCQLFHNTTSPGTWNAYGSFLQQIGFGVSISDRILLAESTDSDGDGDNNITEINNNSQPGWTVGSVNNIYTYGGVIADDPNNPGVPSDPILAPAVGLLV